MVHCRGVEGGARHREAAEWLHEPRWMTRSGDAEMPTTIQYTYFYTLHSFLLAFSSAGYVLGFVLVSVQKYS